MAVLDNIDRKISQIGQGALQKTKDVSENMRLTGAIREEEDRQRELYRQIGERYYQMYYARPQEEFAQWCVQITDSKRKSAQLREQLRILKGTVLCPNCNAEVASGSSFCSNCGARVMRQTEIATGVQTDAGKICRNCGAVLEEEQKFCMVCGTKVEEEMQSRNETVGEKEQTNEIRKCCSNCGKELKPGQAFCNRCGWKVE